MKRIPLLFLFLLLFSGCTVHRFQKSPEEGGYVAARFGYVIPEYTVDLDNKAPQDVKLARARLERRNDTVEKYYIEMGQIENYFQRYVGHFPKIIWSIFANTIKMPFHIVSEYRYEHNEAYRKKIDDLDARQKAREEERINKLKSELREFIAQDLEKEKQLPP
ncbi:MAG: hypothetical protein A3D27_04070 [Omnitrophica WOR_2 bacterium RIFCSPHIGHO2_02_FULL_46_37]|nr:MAG: hypothetical protein A3D27_04070 [Omnitrophica WOR_2 bacterium RIFCSPHIGHO2_02_FULL_46_37]